MSRAQSSRDIAVAIRPRCRGYDQATMLRSRSGRDVVVVIKLRSGCNVMTAIKPRSGHDPIGIRLHLNQDLVVSWSTRCQAPIAMTSDESREGETLCILKYYAVTHVCTDNRHLDIKFLYLGIRITHERICTWSFFRVCCQFCIWLVPAKVFSIDIISFSSNVIMWYREDKKFY